MRINGILHRFTYIAKFYFCLQHPCSGWGALANIAFRNRHERCRKRLRQVWLRDRQLQLEVIAEVQRLTNEVQQTMDHSGAAGMYH
jgi:hypothetical protein